MKHNLFYEYYDTLYKNKDYKKEVAYVLKKTKQITEKLPENILEIGCGTGNHTVHFLTHVKKITALDIDPTMIAIAKKKLVDKGNAITFVKKPLEKLSSSTFDAIYALFNVITYIDNLQKLNTFMIHVAKHLKPGGILLFDCWNGIAALKDPPREKHDTIVADTETIHYKLTPRIDFLKQKVLLTTDLTITKKSGKTIHSTFSFSQTLFTPEEIKYAIENAGLTTLSITLAFTSEKPATEKDWKILFVVRK